MSFIFGPVPSRRLGKSLGIDVIPPKTCSFDCIYCESGPTTRLSITGKDFFDPGQILAELDAFLRRDPGAVDVLTFSSAGEPTLYAGLEELISAIKKAHPEFPLIVLTNGSLLWRPEVRRSLLKADRVVPSLDAVSPDVFQAVNRPHPSLNVDRIIEGLKAFRKEFRGRLHMEIALVEGANDSAEELSAIARVMGKIKPDTVELNTVVRPPALAGTKGLGAERMHWAASFFRAFDVQIVGQFESARHETDEERVSDRIIETVQRRPCTVAELAASLGVPQKRVEEESQRLIEQGELKILRFDDKPFLCVA